MLLNEEIYFEINARGAKSEIKKLVRFLKSAELDDFFEITSDFIHYSDGFQEADEQATVEMTFSNDDLGIEIDEFETDDFLEIFCKVAKNLELSGHIYDSSDEEFHFTSEEGDDSFVDPRRVDKFNDELDAAAYDEELDEE